MSRVRSSFVDSISSSRRFAVDPNSAENDAPVSKRNRVRCSLIVAFTRILSPSTSSFLEWTKPLIALA